MPFDYGRLKAKVLQPETELRLQDLADVHFRNPDIAVRVTFDLVDVRQLHRIKIQDQPFPNHGHAISPAVALPLDDGAGQGVHHRLETDWGTTKLLWQQRQRGSRRFPDRERQVAGPAAHGHHDVPPRRRPGIHHQVLDNVHAVVPRRLKPERVNVRWQVQVVVDVLLYQQPAVTLLGQLHGGIGRVIPANRDEHGHVHPKQRQDRVLEVSRVLRGVRA